MIYAAITITRNDEEFDVELSGQTEYFGSANPHERGVQISDWSVDSPKGTDLTKQEETRALEALERML